MRQEFENGRCTIYLEGQIDSINAHSVEKELLSILEGKDCKSVVLDAAGLRYISSAGLRIILRLKKSHSDLKIINVSSEVYEILDMTGFTQMMTVEKAYKTVSVDGCEVIGNGANGTIYRIDQDTVVKAYNNPDALEDIQHEREVARLALVLGIPTAISYDVVRVGKSFGSVFELLDARSFSKILEDEPDKLEWCVKEYVDLLKKIHSTIVPAGKLPDMKETVLSWARFMQDYLPKEDGEKLLKLVEEVPHDDHMIHGDYHTKNLELQGDEVLIIDMDTLAVGHPVFEFGSMYNAFLGFSELDHSVVKKFQGFDYETSKSFWYKTLAGYLETDFEERIHEVEDKARIIGYTRLIRRAIRRGGMDDPIQHTLIAHWKKELIELLHKYDTLVFSPTELELRAVQENLPRVIELVERQIEFLDCSMKTRMQIDMAVEEVFINVASYAYAPGEGPVRITVKVTEDPRSVVITFADRGIPYDPLKMESPDVNLPADQRQIGGLGVFLVKKTMDDVTYEFKDGQNILTIMKKL